MPFPLIALAASALGAGASLYGANKQSKDNKAAQEQNARLQEQQNNIAWANWLMTRGVAPTQPIEAGVMPTAANSRAVNTRMPLWANINRPTPAPRAGPRRMLQRMGA